MRSLARTIAVLAAALGSTACQGPAAPADMLEDEPGGAGGVGGGEVLGGTERSEAGPAGGAQNAAGSAGPEGGAPSLGPHVYAVFEQDFVAPGSGYSNPWEDVSVQMTVTSPTAHSTTVGGFYFSGTTYKARFRPDEIGTWTWTALVTDTKGASMTASGSFDASGDGGHGFIRKSDDNPNRWKYEDGTPYYGVGLQSCMPKVDGLDTTGGYCEGGTGSEPSHGGLYLAEGKPATLDAFLATNAEGGFNLFRWASYSLAPGLWQSISPKGNVYGEAEGKYGDRVKADARKYGYAILFTIFTYWNHKPPYFESQASLSDDERRALQRYLQYIINRYSAYVDIWEAINEGNGTPAWYAAVIPYLKEHDPYRHGVTTSTVYTLGPAEVASGASINMTHWYAPVTEDVADQWTFDNLQQWKMVGKNGNLGSSTIVGETGNCCKVCNYGPTGFRLRNWAAFFGEGILVYWDDASTKTACGTANTNYYIGDEERASTRALSAFAHGFDPKAKMATDFTVTGAPLRGHALSGPVDYALYLVNPSNHATPTANAKVTVSPLSAGHATWIDPSAGTVLAELDVMGGTQTLEVPAFTTDVALKIHNGHIE